MRIKVINPNTTESMTGKIGEAARAAAAAGTEIVACNPAGGPVSIEGHYDEAVSVLGLLEEVGKGEAGFSIVTTLSRTRVIAAELVERYGMTRFCRAIRATEVAVLDLEREGSEARRIVLEECKRAVAEDHSGAIVLGCAGRADLAAEIQQAIGAPVIDGVAAAVKLVEALVGMSLGTSKVGDLAWPLPKAYTGRLASMAPKLRPDPLAR
jgi:allantoin racemase